MDQWKVLVVDDEKWIRRGLIQSIDWETFHLRLVGEAGDGEEAYTLIKELQPDLLFLDMRMPEVDGKQLLRKISQEFPWLVTVVISGYSDFEYMKEAIRHKAFEYLLKPVKKEDLHILLEKIVDELLNKRQFAVKDKARMTAKLAENLLFEGAIAKDVKLEGLWEKGQYGVIVGHIDYFHEAPLLEDVFVDCKQRLEKDIPFLHDELWEMVMLRTKGKQGEFVLIIAAPLNSKKSWEALSGKIVKRLNQMIGNKMAVSFGISHAHEELLYTAQAYDEASEALKAKRVQEVKAVKVGWEERLATIIPYPEQEEKDFLLILEMGNEKDIYKQFDRWLAIIGDDFITVGQMQHIIFIFLHSVEKQLRLKGTSLERIYKYSLLQLIDHIKQRMDLASMRELLREGLIPALLHYYHKAGEKEGQRVVREVQHLIEQHYNQMPMLQQIANQFDMNPDYLSRLFKKVTGKSFIDYLTDVRLQQAKHLLRKTKYKNYEIAKMVGYEDYRYFSQIFKRKTGQTIGEFKELDQMIGTKENSK